MESGRHQQLSSTEPCARHHHQHSRLILTPLGKALLCPCYRLWGRKARKCPWASVPRHWAPPSCRWTCRCPKGAKMLHKAKPWQHPSLPPAATKPQPLLLGIQRPDLSTPEISFWWLNLFIFYLPKRSLSLFLFFFFNFLATPLSMWDPSSLTRDQTILPACEARSPPLDHQGIPKRNLSLYSPCKSQMYAPICGLWPSEVDAIKSCLVEKEMATHSSILAWRIPWTEEPGRLHSLRSQELDTT